MAARFTPALEHVLAEMTLRLTAPRPARPGRELSLTRPWPGGKALVLNVRS